MTDPQRAAFEAWHKRRYGWFRGGAIDENVIDDRQESFVAGMQAAQAADAGREAVALEATPMEPGQFGGTETAWRMDAYYYSFEMTGIAIIDRILSAVACAGKSFHHTECWNDECSPYEHLRGDTVTAWIQNAADDAADALKGKNVAAINAELVEALEETQGLLVAMMHETRSREEIGKQLDENRAALSRAKEQM